jgi:hypothetical protein
MSLLLRNEIENGIFFAAITGFNGFILSITKVALLSLLFLDDRMMIDHR